MAMAADDIARLIKERFPDAEIKIEDLAGDGNHYAATVVSEEFRGKSRVQQHQKARRGILLDERGQGAGAALRIGAERPVVPCHE